MKVSAMFYVYSTKRIVVGGPEKYNLEVVLMPVTRNVSKNPHSGANPEGTYESPNIDWSKYTPSGQITMTITQAGAQQFFEENIGKDVPVSFG